MSTLYPDMINASKIQAQATNGFAPPASSPLDSALDAQSQAAEGLSDAIHRLVVRLDPIVCEMPAGTNTDNAKALPSGCRLEIVAKSHTDKLHIMTTRIERLLSDLRI